MKATGNFSAGNFGAQWILLCGLGHLIGGAAGIGLAWSLSDALGMTLTRAAAVLLLGAVLGAAQWFALREYTAMGASWAVVTALGLAAGETMGGLMGRVGLLAGVWPVGLTLAGLVTGLAVGLAQWFALADHPHVRGEWIARCVLGFGLGRLIGGLASSLLPLDPWGMPVFVTVAGLVLGALTVGGAVKIARSEFRNAKFAES